MYLRPPGLKFIRNCRPRKPTYLRKPVARFRKPSNLPLFSTIDLLHPLRYHQLPVKRPLRQQESKVVPSYLLCPPVMSSAPNLRERGTTDEADTEAELPSSRPSY